MAFGCRNGKGSDSGLKVTAASDAPISLSPDRNDEDLGLVPEASAMIVAIEHATETGETVTIRVALTDAIIETVEAPKPEAGKRRKAEAPSGMVAKIIALALRPEGVSPAELNTVTEWKGAPWKWLFSNPKGTGYADRWGYRLDVTKDGKATTYRLTASATA
jgi:hypothetical protein